MRTPGIYKDVSIDLYHKEKGISSSGISLILDCPKRYWYEYLSGEVKKEKERFFEIGQALHMFVLEPEKFDDTFYLMKEEVDLRTKEGKKTLEKIQEEERGKTILRANESEMIISMGQALKNHSIWEKIGTEINVEHSVYWNTGLYDTRLRARPDLYTDKLIIDIKTTDSIQSFQKSIFQYGYHRQAAMQTDGLAACDGNRRMFGLFVVEKKAPYLTACFTLDEEALEKGREEYLEGAATYSECLKFGHWEGYEQKFTLIRTPEWMKNR